MIKKLNLKIPVSDGGQIGSGIIVREVETKRKRGWKLDYFLSKLSKRT